MCPLHVVDELEVLNCHVTVGQSELWALLVLGKLSEPLLLIHGGPFTLQP